MAGSYNHCVDSDGRLRRPEVLTGMLDTPGDVYEAVEQFYGMVWYLASGQASDPTTMTPRELVEEARQHYLDGLTFAEEVAESHTTEGES